MIGSLNFFQRRGGGEVSARKAKHGKNNEGSFSHIEYGTKTKKKTYTFLKFILGLTG